MGDTRLPVPRQGLIGGTSWLLLYNITQGLKVDLLQSVSGTEQLSKNQSLYKETANVLLISFKDNYKFTPWKQGSVICLLFTIDQYNWPLHPIQTLLYFLLRHICSWGSYCFDWTFFSSSNFPPGRPCVDCHAFEFMQRALQDLKKTAFNLDARVGLTLHVCSSKQCTVYFVHKYHAI